ncbi:hypothetical protein [Bacillus horti]|uniref:Uncharacterized protein n=1 Tax=Caldalkalibacillus horti TaxID=77523 RepID=A0ABT9VYR3_9BACI|nr:hypothetical protein [Bacillus horti]MDQ0166138.1 hypothetical protein [Bacillus horti]
MLLFQVFVQFEERWHSVGFVYAKGGPDAMNMFRSKYLIRLQEIVGPDNVDDLSSLNLDYKEVQTMEGKYVQYRE